MCLALRGTLTLATAPRAHAGLAKCLADQPAAIIVDVLDLHAGPDILPMFLLMRREARRAPAVPLIMVATPAVRQMLRPYHAHMGLVASRAQALVAALRMGAPERWRQLRLAPGPLAVSLAGNLVSEACAGWHLQRLLHPARRITYELVDNAVRHAGTDVVVTVAHEQRHLLLRVRDGSSAPPVLAEPTTSDAAGLDWRGYGLHRVNRLAIAWGVHLIDDGKVVWASLQTVRRVPVRSTGPLLS